MKGFDCSTPLTTKTSAAFAAAGYSFVGRYLVPSGYGKALKKTEAELINQAGLDIISVFETTANRALGGRTAGINDGYTAIEVAKQVGQPEGSTIYTAVDFDVTPAQMPTVLEYIRGFSEATPRYDTGVYGSYSVIVAAKAERVCSRFWQTYAWSRGKKADGVHIYQYENDVKENGIGIDRNEGYEGLGSWNTLKTEGEKIMQEQPIKFEEDWQWKQLGDALDGIYKKGLIEDYKWAEKAYTRTLTQTELSWLNMVVYARQIGIKV